MNGVGKSAIINSISLFKQVMLNPSLLKQTSEIIKLNKIINKVTKEFYIGIVYGIKFSLEEKEKIYKSEIKIKIENNNPYILNERFSILKDQSINGNYNLLYEVKNGNLSIDNEKLKINTFFKNRTLNILKYSSCSSILCETDILNEAKSYHNIVSNELNNDLGIINYLSINKLFFDNISIYLDSVDIHKEYVDNLVDDILTNQLNVKCENFARNMVSSKKDVVLKNKIEDYKINIKRLTEFLKLFKPSLKYIKLEIAEDETYYYCSKKMIYDSYEVDSDYESTGIQKLMCIYNSIDDVTKGKIVFIDELDANINGVYLTVLLEYLNNLDKGQLCFTTHNLYPMEYLYKYTNSIDFLGETGKLVSWKKMEIISHINNILME